MTNEEAIIVLKYGMKYRNPQNDTEKDRNEALDVALSALEDRPKREWIPTIERLPEIGDTVLCSVKTPECIDHHIIICKYCAEEFWKDGTIRAWQPLPEPYEEETKDWVDKEMAKKYGFFIREDLFPNCEADMRKGEPWETN